MLSAYTQKALLITTKSISKVFDFFLKREVRKFLTSQSHVPYKLKKLTP